ncbi:MAG: hypothetical protein LBQ94_10225 [Treponema sp.]|jgi:hypothetical protein|nr:hypothetical protein [Treponema sp.]
MDESDYFEKDEFYQFLFKYFTRSKIESRYVSLWADIVKVMEGIGHEDKFRIDEESFKLFILDYFTDTARLKDFHDIERTNVNKIYGYGLYWFLRRHPIHPLEGIPSNFAINERVALGVFLPRIMKEAGLPLYVKEAQNESYKKRLRVFIDLLFYNLRFRTYTQQSLELMIEAFRCGCACTRLA